MPFATLADAKVPVAVPLTEAVSDPNKPATVGVPAIEPSIVEV